MDTYLAQNWILFFSKQKKRRWTFSFFITRLSLTVTAEGRKNPTKFEKKMKKKIEAKKQNKTRSFLIMCQLMSNYTSWLFFWFLKFWKNVWSGQEKVSLCSFFVRERFSDTAKHHLCLLWESFCFSFFFLLLLQNVSGKEERFLDVIWFPEIKWAKKIGFAARKLKGVFGFSWLENVSVDWK